MMLRLSAAHCPPSTTPLGLKEDLVPGKNPAVLKEEAPSSSTKCHYEQNDGKTWAATATGSNFCPPQPD